MPPPPQGKQCKPSTKAHLTSTHLPRWGRWGSTLTPALWVEPCFVSQCSVRSRWFTVWSVSGKRKMKHFQAHTQRTFPNIIMQAPKACSSPGHVVLASLTRALLHSRPAFWRNIFQIPTKGHLQLSGRRGQGASHPLVPRYNLISHISSLFQ